MLAHPLEELVEKVRSIAGGDLKQRVSVRGVRELAELSETFNSMSDSLEKSMEKLKAGRQGEPGAVHQLASGRSRPRSTRRTPTRAATPSASRATPSSSRATWGSAAEEVRIIRLSALLHDVGKIGIDDRILRKPTALTNEEFEIMKTHPIKGALIMGQIPQLKDVIPGIKHHHEKWSGGGYPDGLKGENIPLVGPRRRRGGHVRRDDDDAPLPEGHAAHLRHPPDQVLRRAAPSTRP